MTKKSLLYDFAILLRGRVFDQKRTISRTAQPSNLLSTNITCSPRSSPRRYQKSAQTVLEDQRSILDETSIDMPSIKDKHQQSAGGANAANDRLKAPIHSNPRPSNAPNPARDSGVWQVAGRTNALKSGLASARNPTQGPRPQSVYMPGPATPSDVAGRMNRLDIQGPTSQNWRSRDGPYNPSLGPTPTAMTTKFRETIAASHATDRTRRQAFQNAVCKLSNYTRSDFKVGDVIAAPFHVPNTNPHVDPRDDRLTFTREGPAYSKRRMMVVLFRHHQTDLFCLPLYSFSGRGLREKPDTLKPEFVSVCNAGTPPEAFRNHGVHPAVQVVARRPLDDTTTVHLSGGLRVGFSEDITRVGRLTEESYGELVNIWKGLVGTAEGEGW